jgi:hypothetical protein
MNGWMNGWMDGWMDRQLDKFMLTAPFRSKITVPQNSRNE